MKNYKKPATSKVVKGYDNLLKNLLMEDLKAYRLKHPFFDSIKQELIQNLSAA